MKFAIYKPATGEIVRTITCDIESILQQIGPLESYVQMEQGDDSTHYIVSGVPTLLPSRPDDFHVFDWATKQWEDPRTLVDLKLACTRRINTARLLANQSGFIHMGKLIATDPLSRSDIDGINGYVTLYGDLPENWAGAWKAEDNTYLPISNLDEWKAFYASMVAAGNMNFAISEQLKAALALADTPVEIEVIVWPT